ncbi:MAG: DUF935 family protein [Chloroherpetonaceae bacterium]
MYSYSALNSQTYPSPEQLLKSLRKLKSDLPENVDDRPFIATAERAKMVNSRLAGLIRKRKTAINAFGWKIIDIKTAQESEDMLIIEQFIKIILEHFWELPAFGKLAFDIKWGDARWNILQNGQLGAVGHNQIPVSFKKRDKYNYKCYGEDFYEYDTNRLIKQDDSIIIMSTDAYLFEILFSELYRHDATNEAGNFIRKLKGLLQVIDKGGTPEDRTIAEQAAEQVVKNNYVSTSDMIEFKLNQLTATSGSIFKELIEMYNNDETIAILGQANTTQLPDYGGSRAALQVQNLVTADITYSDMGLLETFVSKFLAIYDMRNYSEIRNKFVLNLTEEQDIEKNALAVNDMLNTTLPFVKSEIYGMLGMTPPAESDEIVQIEKGI